MSRLYKQYKEQKELINDLLEQVSAEVNRNVENCTNLHIKEKKEKKDKETMEYQYARIKALEDKVKQLEAQNKDLSYILTLTETELCEKKESLKQALKYSGAL